MDKKTFNDIYRSVLREHDRNGWVIVTNISHGLGINGVDFETFKEIVKKAKSEHNDGITIKSEVKEISETHIVIEVVKETVNCYNGKITYDTIRNYIPYENIVSISVTYPTKGKSIS